jgi:putative transposase
MFVPERRRSAIYGEIRTPLGGIFHEVARQKECPIIEGPVPPDHVHLCLEIPPTSSVASVIAFLKGKSAIARLQGRECHVTDEHVWARGEAVSTVGIELEQRRADTCDQEALDEAGRF